jgi:hypothetical protein
MNCGEEIVHCEVEKKTSESCLTTHCFVWVLDDRPMMMNWKADGCSTGTNVAKAVPAWRN